MKRFKKSRLRKQLLFWCSMFVFFVIVTVFWGIKIALIRGYPDFSNVALAGLVSDEMEWGDDMVLYYTTDDGTEYRMLCDEVFVAGPFTKQDKLPLSMEGRDFDKSYSEVKDEVIYSEWWGKESEYPIVHAIQLRKVRGQIISVSKRYLVFQECGLTNATEADITAYLDEHPLEIVISLGSDQEHYGCTTASHTKIPTE